MFNRKYIDSIRVHFPACYVSLPECSNNKHFTMGNHGIGRVVKRIANIVILDSQGVELEMEVEKVAYHS